MPLVGLSRRYLPKKKLWPLWVFRVCTTWNMVMELEWCLHVCFFSGSQTAYWCRRFAMSMSRSERKSLAFLRENVFLTPNLSSSRSLWSTVLTINPEPKKMCNQIKQNPPFLWGLDGLAALMMPRSKSHGGLFFTYMDGQFFSLRSSCVKTMWTSLGVPIAWRVGAKNMKALLIWAPYTFKDIVLF